MKLLKYIILLLIILNLPSKALVTMGESIGSLLSYITILLLTLYYFFSKKTTPNWSLIIIALTYFIIGSFQYHGPSKVFIFETIKYFIFIICGYELVKKVSNVELFYFFLIGSITIGFDALFNPTRFGRYAGFYLNPNVAGFMCIYGYSLVYSIKNTTIKLSGQFIFTLMGLLTFSRTFIVIWVVLNLISLKISVKNLRILGIVFLIFSTLIVIDEIVGLNNPRFEQLKSIVNNEKVSTEEVNQDSRAETWALFYDDILAAPIFGNGYGTFSGKLGSLGAHNTYLMIIGEAGIIPLTLFIGYIGYILYWSISFFKRAPNLIMQTIALVMFLLANHNFFIFYFVSFAAMWIQYQIYEHKKIQEINEKQLEYDKF
ncbi:O-antigen ligase family protein [Winogradskyella costae]|uniref:O-antigen ligase family protein n=1 Tax=Winogradskyella costae TaxID=2697008 RepID=UPI0015C795CA|nr:O-antigen ligase family protein [Winogradskyella costae]